MMMTFATLLRRVCIGAYASSFLFPVGAYSFFKLEKERFGLAREALGGHVSQAASARASGLTRRLGQSRRFRTVSVAGSDPLCLCLCSTGRRP